MFLAERLVLMKMSPLAVSKATYFMSGLTQQLVWPNMVSGLRVAATRKMFLPFMPLLGGQNHYSCLKEWVEVILPRLESYLCETFLGCSYQSQKQRCYSLPAVKHFGLEFCCVRFNDFHLDERVLLRPNSLQVKENVSGNKAFQNKRPI